MHAGNANASKARMAPRNRWKTMSSVCLKQVLTKKYSILMLPGTVVLILAMVVSAARNSRSMVSIIP